MKHNIIKKCLLFLLIPLLSFQCDREEPAYLTIVEGNLLNTCSPTQESYKVRLYQRYFSVTEVSLVDSLIVNVGDKFTFEALSRHNLLAELVADQGGSCFSSWAYARNGQRNQVDLSYLQASTNLSIFNNRAILPTSSILVQINRLVPVNDNGFTAEIEVQSERILYDSLQPEDFPLENITLARGGLYIASLFELTNDGRQLLVNTNRIDTQNLSETTITF